MEAGSADPVEEQPEALAGSAWFGSAAAAPAWLDWAELRAGRRAVPLDSDESDCVKER